MDVTANSGSPADIQAAVNAVVAAGGGNVYIPAGDFAFRPAVYGAVSFNVPTGGINIFGAGKGVTILRADIPPPDTNTVFEHFRVNGLGRPFRISGISFLGNVNNDAAQNIGIRMEGGVNCRVDHCAFDSFTNQGVFSNGNRGVIDHCDFDNTYKDKIPLPPSVGMWVWGYGIICVNWGITWIPDITTLLGKYDGLAVLYIEDCTFTRCRHAIASNYNGYYVSRYNHFQKCAPYGQCDIHGGQPGGRGIEAYNNTYDFSDESYSYGQDACLQLRGGGGVVFNNTVIFNPNFPNRSAWLLPETVPPYDIQKLYIWGNTAAFNSKITNDGGYTENVNYFLRAPNQTQDGFTYTPYVYPHPLASGIEPPPALVTPNTETLVAGTYKITMPTQVQAGADLYNFKQWEDGSINPVLTINLNQDLSLTATYEKVTVNLTINVNDLTMGTTDPIPETYKSVQGSNVQISSIPSTGYMFDHWELDGVNVGSTSPYSVLMDTDHSILAVFVEIPPPPPGKRNITISATVGGTTIPEVGTWEFNEGVSIQVSARPDNEHSFDHFELDGVASKGNPITITMDIDHSLLAVFTVKPVPIPLWKAGAVILAGLGGIVTGIVVSKV